MATLTTVRNALANKIWNGGLSRNVTVKTVSSSTQDAYGEVYNTAYTSTTSKCVPYNTFTYQRSFQGWGELGDGETDMVFPYDTTITQSSVVVDSILSATYDVVALENFPFGEGSVATVARLKEQL